MSYSPPVRTVWPTAWPVSVPDAKVQWSVDRTDHDNFISTLLQAATFTVETLIGRVLITSTWRQDFASFTDEIRLGMGDVIAVSSVNYYDAENASQVLDTDIYDTVLGSLGTSLALTGGEAWPSPYARGDAVRVTWTAGFGPAAADVPPPLRYAVSLLAQYWYDNGPQGQEDIPAPVLRLISPYVRRYL